MNSEGPCYLAAWLLYRARGVLAACGKFPVENGIARQSRNQRRTRVTSGVKVMFFTASLNHREQPMRTFLERFGNKITGTLSGFDRLRLRGTKRWLAHTGGMLSFLGRAKVLLKDFDSYVQDRTQTLSRAINEAAQTAGRPVIYLPNRTDSKAERASELAARDHIQQGLIGVWKCVEPCWSYEVYKNRDKKELELKARKRQCLHYYHYYLHPQLGFMHTRLQTWFPFTMQICLNGREWLAQQMAAAGISHARQGNCFVRVGDRAAAQALLDAQLQVNWPELLDKLAGASNPADDTLLGGFQVPYYWSVDQSEWATDILFRTGADLAALYPRLLQHGILILHSRDVLRFLGQKLTRTGEIHGNFQGEVLTDLRARPEGMRIKHWLNRNSVKMYDKAYTSQGAVLRLEVTVNDVSDLKAYRTKEGEERGARDWRPLRKGIADLHRRAEISQKATERYAESLATLEDTTTLAELTEPLCQPVFCQGKRYRALNPLSTPDARLLAAVNRGEFLLNGFRNRDLRALLYAQAATASDESRRQSAAITRKLRLLRAHRLIEKVPKTLRYRLTANGQRTIAALLSARQANTVKLSQAA
jgi:hypothetical protein